MGVIGKTIYLQPETFVSKVHSNLPKFMQDLIVTHKDSPAEVKSKTIKAAVGAATAASFLIPGAGAAAGRGAAAIGKSLIPKTVGGAIKAAILVPTAAGVLTSSKTARDIAKKIINPVENIKRGKTIGELIEDPGKAEDILGLKNKNIKEKVVAGLKAAGLVGAAAAVAVGGVAAVKKGKAMLEAWKEAKAEKSAELPSTMKEFGFTEPQPVGLGGVPVTMPKNSLTGAPGSTQMQPPISNIIQIQIT